MPSTKLTLLEVAISLCLCAIHLPLRAQTPPAKKLNIDRLYTLPWVIGSRPEAPVWSPDSRHLAFLWNDEGTSFYDVWLTDAATGKPARITSMPRPEGSSKPGKDVAALERLARVETDHGVSSVLWAHDGRHLLFTLHGGLYEVLPGEAPKRLADSGVSLAVSSPVADRVAYICGTDLCLIDLANPKPAAWKLYSPGKPEVFIEELHWSPGGTRIAFVETDTSHVLTRGIPNYLGKETTLDPVKRPFPGETSDSRRLGIISTESSPVRSTPLWADLTRNLGRPEDPLDPIFGVAWSPDSSTLLVDKSDLYIKDRRLLLVDPATGHGRELLREADPRNVTAEWWSDWAPDGRGVYFTSDRGNDYHVFYEPLAGGEPKPITSGNFAVFSASISPDALFVVTNEGKREERHLFRVSLNGGQPQRITQIPGTHTPVISPDGHAIADIFSADTIPPDLYLMSTAQNEPKQVTHSPLPEFNEYHWVAAKYVDFSNVHDGTMLHARLTLPPNFDPAKKYPAILGSVYSNTVHNQWGGRIFHPTWGLDQYLAQQGYVILNVDISGSSGYGKLFRQRIGLDYGGIDTDDLFSGVQYLIAQGFVDPARVGIWGSSYGGLLTATSLFTHPGVYKAGVAGAPATSLFHAQTGEMRTMMAPQDHMQQYERSSAFLKSGGLVDHLMIIHGMKDDTVLFKDSVTLTQRLILQGGDIDLVVLPNAPHGWDTEGLAQTRFAYHKLVDYFGQYLGEGPTQ